MKLLGDRISLPAVMIMLWSSIAILSLTLGYRSVPLPPTSKISFGLLPTAPPDAALTIDLWSDQPQYMESQELLALVTEKNIPERNDVRFLCPRFPDQISNLYIRFPLSPSQKIEKAFLHLRLLAATIYDPQAKVKVFVSSESTRGIFVELVELSAQTEEDQIPREFDILPYVKDSSYLRIRVSCVATKLIYHPTPNDPIGYATGQALRQARYENAAATLQLWYDKPNKS
jgi:hypothetical protein